MTRKKADKTTSQTTIQNNPFKSLKGFSVSAAEDKPAESRVKTPANATEIEVSADFSEEMSRLGVQPIGGRRGADAVHPQEVDKVIVPTHPVSDEELFVAELGKLDTVFADRYPDDEEPLAAAPRRMKLLRQGKLKPEASVDLHGLSRVEAREKVCYFLENAMYHGMKTVLIVTGWGRGSGSEPVLRGEIEHYLSGEGKILVAEWGRAPRQHGGDGALVVFLKSADKIP